jgi:hypothetical protein
MSVTTVNKVFGEMEYKHSWTKKDSFLFMDKAYPVNITAQAYKGDDILEIQQLNYSHYKTYLEKHKDEIENKLIQYCKEICNNELELSSCLTPKTVIFERDNSWGILFDTDCDVENGVALFVVNDKIEVGPQDLFL